MNEKLKELTEHNIFKMVADVSFEDTFYPSKAQIKDFQKQMDKFKKEGFICGLSCDNNYKATEIMSKLIFNYLIDMNFNPYYYKVYDRNSDIAFQDHINTYGLPDCIFLATYWEKMQIKYFDKLREMITVYGENLAVFILNAGLPSPVFLKNVVGLPYDCFLHLTSSSKNAISI